MCHTHKCGSKLGSCTPRGSTKPQAKGFKLFVPRSTLTDVMSLETLLPSDARISVICLGMA